ncbi:cobalt/nickel transport protein [Oryzomicrobium terrae]|uniref:Cobalt transport protein CbiN n=1 Tax=Oryzomicrobium terrae TaxID=1735038 RepID=A0A5C1EA95_9RHOO|nr:energy-coupling factor ABC transporter substrate-binding protein [Oryzomicrobium terrae]QEL65087.1 cobalt/nickel transport protein [Oryzomicrobium terrae]
MKGRQNLLLLLAVVLLAALPLWLVEKPAPDALDAEGKPVEIFGGADGKAQELIGKINPDYQPWFQPLLEPASNEIASLLFALQAALGAGFIGYYLGSAVTREKLKREQEKQVDKARQASASEDNNRGKDAHAG